jgi:hypothetical protein
MEWKLVVKVRVVVPKGPLVLLGRPAQVPSVTSCFSWMPRTLCDTRHPITIISPPPPSLHFSCIVWHRIGYHGQQGRSALSINKPTLIC